MTISPRLRDALPFWLSLGMVPLVVLAARLGGLWFLLLPAYGWALVTLIDALVGIDEDAVLRGL